VCALLIRPTRLVRAAIVVKPATLLRLHRALKTRKYRLLFSSAVRKKSGPRGPSRDVVAAVIEMKRRNPTCGSPRIAQQIALAFDIPINKDVVRRILAVNYRPEPDSAGPSWLTVLGHAKDSLHASHCGLRRASRRRRRRRAVPHVQSSDAWPDAANLRQLGP
jgi:hypothetical protein